MKYMVTLYYQMKVKAEVEADSPQQARDTAIESLTPARNIQVTQGFPVTIVEVCEPFAKQDRVRELKEKNI